jgi:dihydrofolate reductase
MRKLGMFNHVSVDGYFVDAKGDMSWAHSKPDVEWEAFIAGNASGEGELLFGRITYDMMASFWTTAQAIKSMPAVAAGMNSMPKVVFSRTMDKAPWNNTTVGKGELAAEIGKMKQASGPDMVILGSGSIVSQLAAEGLIDEFQIAVTPVALGKGRTLFEGVKEKLNLKLTKSRVFGNGHAVLWYEPLK